MRAYRVIAHGQYNTALSTSNGYSSRAAAERVAAGLAASGKAPFGVSVEGYDDPELDADSNDSNEA